MIATTLPETLVVVLIPCAVTVLIALIGVLWRSGIDRGRDNERAENLDRRLTRIENRVFSHDGGGGPP